jgi:Zn-dependent protease with chaperone function
MELILSFPRVKSTIESIVNDYYGHQIENIKKVGVPVTSIAYPRLYNTIKECCRCLNVGQQPEVILTRRIQGINALSVGSDLNPMILLSMKSAICLPVGELKFLIGHELGHILQKNMICHTVSGLLLNLKQKSEILGTMIADLIEMPLKEWCRCSEYTADRAGLMCCKDMEYVYSLMAKVKRYERQSMAPQLMELYKDHPFIDKRLEKLKAYSNENTELIQT